MEPHPNNHHHHNNHNSHTGSNHQEQPEVYHARLCHIVKWDDFDGYGFNLHAEKGKVGQYIGKVDDNSPSEAAGLRQGDRIIEVNEINIAGETHKQVVERIKAFPQETKLLVVDAQADEYFRAHNTAIKGSMPGVKVMKTPERSSMAREDSGTSEASTAPAENNSACQMGNQEQANGVVTKPEKMEENGTTVKKNFFFWWIIFMFFNWGGDKR